MDCRCLPVGCASDGGAGLFGECLAPTDRLFVAVDGGDTFTVGVVAGSGEVVGWGCAFYGELPAVGNALVVDERCTAVACGSNHVLALADSGRVVAWGWNASGQAAAAASEEVVRVPTPVEFPVSVRVVQVAAGGMHSLALDSSGRLWAWGSNEFGQLGIGSEVQAQHSPARVALPAGVRVQHVAAGWAHSALVSTTGDVFTFGWGLYNQLGHGSTQNELEPVVVDALQGLDSDVVQVACGNWHTAALTASGDLYTWGWGKDGQLGHRDAKATQVFPRVVNVLSASSDEAQDVLSLACGHRFTLALCRDGSVQYWGPRGAPTRHKSPPADQDDASPGWLRQPGRHVRQLAAGSTHAILLLERIEEKTIPNTDS
ncbi:E3 ubiquitin-protein ligase HERC4 [Phytophthora cinnamomi]|uniref:E3 ubiquitin-protein ligase HERC4 n=1 Tax=Phytophthora cinnamomi TaxID=4785 RepID=UPI003559D8E7|nr:E3 ubiquitin-protein ligase HERC4 [Phytophthora cinnamomi]